MTDTAKTPHVIILRESVLQSWLRDAVTILAPMGAAVINHLYAGGSWWIYAVIAFFWITSAIALAMRTGGQNHKTPQEALDWLLQTYPDLMPRAATSGVFLSATGSIAAWIEECTLISPLLGKLGDMTGQDLYASYTDWAARRGVSRPESWLVVRETLKARGVCRVARRKDGRFLYGPISLRRRKDTPTDISRQKTAAGPSDPGPDWKY